MQLRAAEELPPSIPIQVIALNSRPSKVIAVDRDAWVRLIATRSVEIKATPRRMRDWWIKIGELGGVA
ncbi:hypothetical protein [Demequina oxidasica]|uniref:hypothetical protein n=1 Tax=Demequina oxidasica TaxID=676199 RepID=UPI0007861F73|nr:hypothetical protein [Demequina oxidasica]